MDDNDDEYIPDDDIDDDDIPLCSHNAKKNVKKRRRRFSLQEKMCLVRSIRRKIENEKVSIRMACKDENIHHKMYLNWRKSFQQMIHAKNLKAKSFCTGRLSVLKEVEEPLLKFIFELREQGMAVSHQIVMINFFVSLLIFLSFFLQHYLCLCFILLLLLLFCFALLLLFFA